MSLLSELTSIAKKNNLPVETAVFSETPPDEYLVLTPLNDDFALMADNIPLCEVQEVRVSIYTKNNYMNIKDTLIRSFFSADMTVTEHRYIGHEDDTGYHHYAIDVAKNYDWRNA